MGKKGSWFSAIKKVFTPHSKEKHLNNNNQEPERKSNNNNNKEKKKKSLGKKQKHGETNSFLPSFRQPSSIEKILCEAEREHNLVFRPPSPKASSPFAPSSPLRLASPRVTSQRYVSSPKPISPRKASSRVLSPKPSSPPRIASPRAPSPRAFSPRVVQRREFVHRPEPTLRVKHASATKIQAGFRGYMARRSFRALKGLVRLQGVVRGQSVKRQTSNAMKYMQLLVRVQTQVQSRRIQMLEKRARNEKDDPRFASGHASNDWDDSVLTKEEKEARLHRKIDAVIKRERSMAYAYSHQLWKNSPRFAQDIRASGYPLWWNWVDRKKSQNTPQRDFKLTPVRPTPSPSPQLQYSNNQNHFRLNNNSFDTSTPNSSKSVFFTPSRPIHTPQPHSSVSRYSRGGGGGGGRGAMQDSPFKDDDSLTSCPPFSAPSYMAPTVSAKAKLRASSNPKDRVDRSPVTTNEKRRSSFPSFKWNKGSLFMSSNSNNKKGPGSSSSGVVELEKHKTLKSVGNLSIDSTVSMPATVGRKSFNRFA